MKSIGGGTSFPCIPSELRSSGGILLLYSTVRVKNFVRGAAVYQAVSNRSCHVHCCCFCGTMFSTPKIVPRYDQKNRQTHITHATCAQQFMNSNIRLVLCMVCCVCDSSAVVSALSALLCEHYSETRRAFHVSLAPPPPRNRNECRLFPGRTPNPNEWERPLVNIYIYISGAKIHVFVEKRAR